MTLRPRFWGSMTAMFLGILMILSVGMNPEAPGGNGVGGAVVVIGSLIYRSAKRSVLGMAKPAMLRRTLEAVGVVAIVAVIGFQRNLALLVRDDPFQNLVIPIWAVTAFFCARLGRAATVTAKFGG